MTKIDKNSLGQLLKNRHLSQKEFARQMGVSLKSVQLWIKGEQLPNMKYIPKMMDILKVQDINHIFFIK